MKTLKKHFVEFFSPGTLVAERTTKEIESWDIDLAKKMAKSIKKRYGAIPYGFQFVTRERGENDFDSKETARSGTYFLGGQVLTLAQIKKRNDPDDRILISNMECNKWNKIIVNTNSWEWTQPLEKKDVVLD